MKVTVLSHMPFGGKQRKPGDVIPQDIWLGATETARSAMINGGYVRVGDAAPAAQRSGESEASTDTIELLQGISAKQGRILSLLGDRAAAAPAKKARKAPAKKKRS